MAELKIREVANGVVVGAKIVPGSSRTAICGLLDGTLKVRVSAPPEKGKANKCLVEFLSKKLGVKKNAVSIISGQKSPVKQVHVLGISGEVLSRRLNLNDDGGGR
ncbi:MAG: DUF167 domain-containing protein [Planctomycetota bacterium]|jgi:uncharacterized protein (TIGR00251 family)